MSVPETRVHGPVPLRRSSRRLLTSKRTYGVLAVALALGAQLSLPSSSFADNAGGCDFAATGTTPSCLGALSGSTFAGGDGNLKTSPTTFGTTDWQNVGGLNTGVDLPSGTGDNSFGQGTKEDNANVSVVTGSIPPQKSDLTRFYEASEFANNNNFLYLAWERTNSLGSANMDFEINQKTQPDLTTTGAKTLVRTAGDLLVTFDFTNGGGRPTVGLLRWVTSGSTSQCFSSNSLPCWGNQVTLDGSEAIGAVNNLDAVTDPFLAGTNNIGTNRFGETAINLTAAGVFPSGTCTAFGSAFLKSRSSSSFPAEVKDFVAPVPVNISNCGSVKIIKHTDPRGIDQKFSYTSNLPAEASGDVNGVHQGGVACASGGTDGVQADGSFCLNDSGNTSGDSAQNTIYNNALPAGSYTVTEGADPAGFAFKTLVCSGGTTSVSGRAVTITLAADDAVVCTYTNQQQVGAIKILKTSSKASADPLAGAEFEIKGPDGNAISGSPFTTNANGVVCVDGLTTLGDYTVKETKAPTGYAIDDGTAKTVTVTGSNATCADTTFTGQSRTFTDTPLTDITVHAKSQATGGTKSTITCVDSTNTSIGDSGANPSDPADVSITDLTPGTYTCTVVIDP